MDELLRQVLLTLAGMWRKRWFGLVAAWLVSVAGVFVILSMPDKYEASARIYVDTQSVLRPLMSGIAVQPNVDQQIAILSRTLISRPNVERLARMADLDLGTKTKEDLDRLVDGLMHSLEIKTAGRDNLYTLSFRDTQPERAKRVVQSLVSIFVESGIGDKRKDSDSALKFIQEQINSYEKKLEQAEDRLKDFKLKNMNLSEEGKNYFARIGEVSAKLKDAQLDLREAEDSRDVLKRELGGEEPLLLSEAPSGTSQGSVPEIDNRIDALKRNLDSLLLRYTAQHPDVVGTRKVIAELEEQKRQELKARSKAGGARTVSAGVDPVLQQLRMSLTEADANVAALRARVAEYESRFNELRNAAKQQPEIDAEFAKMNRDYDIQKKNYEALVARRESAAMSEQMGSTTGVADFRMIDPPRVSPKPVEPDRLLFLPLVLLGGLLSGLGVSFVASQIWPIFIDCRSLRDLTGLPVLGGVSFLKDPASVRRERRRLLAFLAGLGGLFVSYGATLLFLWLATARTT
ncbi:MAG TPA: XrtA system polysaccharide chain length determinant [Rhodocyclaceae bacterium]|nr:XrtA system polysaccharide chain length determinant [Rhodocyclaceae bacterium]HUY02626.1 XrtA system polysaccharide chain length determinant [Rhodocyclaceae bacterium]